MCKVIEATGVNDHIPKKSERKGQCMLLSKLLIENFISMNYMG